MRTLYYNCGTPAWTWKLKSNYFCLECKRYARHYRHEPYPICCQCRKEMLCIGSSNIPLIKKTKLVRMSKYKLLKYINRYKKIDYNKWDSAERLDYSIYKRLATNALSNH